MNCFQITGKDIASAFCKCLEFYGIENKVQGITVDNAASNTKFMQELKTMLSQEGIDFDVENSHFRCFPHILNLAVQDILKLLNANAEIENFQDVNGENDGNDFDDNVTEGDDTDEENEEDVDDGAFSETIDKVRSLFKKIRRKQSLRVKLKAICQLKGISYVKPSIDVITRWNSTYEMLKIAFRMKTALKMLCQDCEELKKFDVLDEEWSSLDKLLPLLGNINYITNLLSHEKTPTLPTAVVAFNVLLDKIECTMASFESNKNKLDTALAFALQSGRDKMLKHYVKCNWVYSISLILDPRHRYESFDSTQWGKDLKKETIQKFEDLYRSHYYHATDRVLEEEKKKVEKKEMDSDFLDLSSIYSAKKKSEHWREEINRYLDIPEVQMDVDVLQWWKKNAALFPCLSKMARDILAIPASSVSVERFFSTGSLVMTKLRASLKDETLRQLMLINSWSKSTLRVEICESDIIDY